MRIKCSKCTHLKQFPMSRCHFFKMGQLKIEALAHCEIKWCVLDPTKARVVVNCNSIKAPFAYTQSIKFEY